MKTSAAKRKQPAAPVRRNRGAVQSSRSAGAQAGQAQDIRHILSPSGIQAKLSVGQPNDRYEQEADRVADHVVAGRQAPSISSLSSGGLGGNSPPQRAEKSDEDEKRFQRKAEEEEEQAAQAKMIQCAHDDEDEKKSAQAKFVQCAAGQAVPAGSGKPDEEPAELKHLQMKKEDEEKHLQAKAEQEEEPVQAKGGAPSAGAAARAVSAKSGGSPMRQDVRNILESRIGSDFSGVRVHEGASAQAAAKSIGAKAFTHQNSIWLGEGQSQSDLHLMAHEATHVVQQSGGAPQRVYRTGSGTGDNTPVEGVQDGGSNAPEITNTETEYDGPKGTASTSTNSIHIKEIQFPEIPEKAEKTGNTNVRIRKGEGERNTSQITEWSRLTRGGDGLKVSLDGKTKDNRDAWHSGRESNPTYFMKIGSARTYLVGTRTAIRDRVIRPYWDETGHTQLYDVDHKKEYQLGGDDSSPEDNLWLLDSSANRSSGSRINNKINEELGSLLSAWTSSRKPDVETARNSYDVTLDRIHWNGPVNGNAGKNYSADDIKKKAIQMGPVHPMDRLQVQQAGLNPGEGEFVVFNNSSGGRARKIRLPSSNGDSIPFTDEHFIPGFRPTSATFTGVDSHYIEISGMLWANNPALYGHGMRTRFTITRMPNLPQAGYLNFRRAEEQIRELFNTPGVRARSLSPLQLNRVGVDDLGAPVVEGIVNTDISFLEGANIGFFIRGNDLGVEKTFSSSELKTPSPFEIEEASLTVSLSTQRGLAVEGNVDFKLGGIGEGVITANVGTSQEFALAGNFNFDERIFGEGTNAQARMAYENGQWSVGGTLTIPEGKVPGVKTATIAVDYSETEGFSASGDAELDVPGVESGRLEVTHNEETGLSIGGSFSLSADTPGIRGGSISAEVREREGGEGYAVRATGEAQPDIPGINSNLMVSYNDGAFTAKVEAAYARGMLSGSVNAGVTNRNVDERGELSETAQPGNPLIVYGGGELTIQIAPWLQGTAGIRFAPNGEVTVSGEIGLPNELEIFGLKEINKPLFGMSTQVPVFPGIVAEVGGNLSAHASIGPGAFDQLRIGIEYNPAHEENTRVTGDAHLNIPAEAGMRLGARAGIGLGITGASATGGLEIGGTLGIGGAAEAGVHIDWTPATGLRVDAEGSLHAEPKFKFDISGYVAVTALGFSVYDNRWELAAYEFGSNERFGVRFPIHYREGQPFNVSLNDVRFETPDVDVAEMVRGVIRRAA